jgi:hypothetical protein
VAPNSQPTRRSSENSVMFRVVRPVYRAIALIIGILIAGVAGTVYIYNSFVSRGEFEEHRSLPSHPAMQETAHKLETRSVRLELKQEAMQDDIKEIRESQKWQSRAIYDIGRKLGVKPESPPSE